MAPAITAAIITAVLGGIVLLLGARVARNATRYAAELQAAQRRRDTELAVLKEFSDSVTELTSAAGSYVFAVRHMEIPPGKTWKQFVDTLPEDQKRQRISLLMDLVVKREVSRALSSALPWADIREQYSIFDTWAGHFRDDQFQEATKLSNDHPNLTNNLIAVIGGRRRDLMATYPVAVPKPRRWWHRTAPIEEIAPETPDTPPVQQAAWVAEIPPSTEDEG